MVLTTASSKDNEKTGALIFFYLIWKSKFFIDLTKLRFTIIVLNLNFVFMDLTDDENHSLIMLIKKFSKNIDM